MIARAKGRFRTYLKKRVRRALLCVVISLALALVIRTTTLQVFHLVTNAVTPVVPKGARVVVNKLTKDFVIGDIIIYKEGKRNIVGQAKNVDVDGKILVSSKVREDKLVNKEAIVGRAFFCFSPIKRSSPME